MSGELAAMAAEARRLWWAARQAGDRPSRLRALILMVKIRGLRRLARGGPA